MRKKFRNIVKILYPAYVDIDFWSLGNSASCSLILSVCLRFFLSACKLWAEFVFRLKFIGSFLLFLLLSYFFPTFAIKVPLDSPTSALLFLCFYVCSSVHFSAVFFYFHSSRTRLVFRCENSNRIYPCSGLNSFVSVRKRLISRNT